MLMFFSGFLILVGLYRKLVYTQNKFNILYMFKDFHFFYSNRNLGKSFIHKKSSNLFFFLFIHIVFQNITHTIQFHFLLLNINTCIFHSKNFIHSKTENTHKKLPLYKTQFIHRTKNTSRARQKLKLHREYLTTARVTKPCRNSNTEMKLLSFNSELCIESDGHWRATYWIFDHD